MLNYVCKLMGWQTEVQVLLSEVRKQVQARSENECAKTTCLGLNEGQDMENRAAHTEQEFR